MAGGWVVGKSDFNENPVVSLDLDLDFDLGFVNISCLTIRVQPKTSFEPNPRNGP